MNLSASSAADQLSVQQLRTFCRVYELQGYSAAAAELQLSVPAAWEQVRALQERYGTELFQRKGRQIVPTLAGDELYRALQPVLAGLDSTFDLLRDETLAPRQPITIVAGARMMLEDLGPALRKFQAEFPAIQLRMLDRDNRTAQELIASGGADLAFSLQPGPGYRHDAVEMETAYRVDYLAIVHKRHALAKKPRWKLKDIVGQPLLIGHAGTHVRQLFEQALHRAGLHGQMTIVAETDNSAFTIACVKSGMGVGILAGNPAGALCQQLAVRSLGDELGEARIVCQWKRGRQLPPAMQRLIAAIREAQQA